MGGVYKRPGTGMGEGTDEMMALDRTDANDAIEALDAPSISFST